MNETWFDKIEQYLSGNMSPEARSHFESEIASNEELYALFAEYQVIETEMRNAQKHSANEAALENTLKKLNAVYFTGTADEMNKAIEIPGSVHRGKNIQEAGATSKPSQARSGSRIKKLNSWRTWSAAAAVLGIVSLGVLWYFNNQQISNQVAVKKDNAGRSDNNKADTSNTSKTNPTGDTLLQRINAPEPGVTKQDDQKISDKKNNSFGLNNAGRQQLFAASFIPDNLPLEIPPLLQETMEDYRAARHQEALEGFESAEMDMGTRGMEDDDKLVPFYIHYYKAQSLLATNQAYAAIAELRKAIPEIPDRFTGNKVNWYLALAYLKNGNIIKAKQLLQQLSGSETAGQYKQKADTLLKAIVR